MSRPSSTSARNLSLTEELEKIEQSITLTLQEIDHNFSRAHRIVTTSILPVVEQYAEHSKAVWDGSKFWKQFFEASANVSLSGYEELAASERSSGDEEEEDTSYTASQDTTSMTTSQPEDDDVGEDTVTASEARPARRPASREDDETISSLLSSPSLTNSTPVSRPPEPQPSFANLPSPYETLRRETLSPSRRDDEPPSTPDLSTPRPNSRLPNLSMTPANSSPFQPAPTTTHKKLNNDLLLHRVLDKTYRLQATPHLPPSSKKPSRRMDQTAADSSPLSSPDVPMPTLHAEIFPTPVRNERHRNRNPLNGPRTPGVSVYDSPGRRRGPRSGGGEAQSKPEISGHRGAWDSDSEEDDTESGFAAGMSPPKTMQFAVPTSRLLRTPAPEASKAIVSNLLQSAGLNTDDDDNDYDDDDESSLDNTTYDHQHRRGSSQPAARAGSISPSLVVGRGVGGGGGGGGGGRGLGGEGIEDESF
ncbi:MAG: DASH complex subunit ask1 [Sclerophora amabilis]|nr:MAG: DASH complex subunit ask1 [Sclerophora amabilis]